MQANSSTCTGSAPGDRLRASSRATATIGPFSRKTSARARRQISVVAPEAPSANHSRAEALNGLRTVRATKSRSGTGPPGDNVSVCALLWILRCDSVNTAAGIAERHGHGQVSPKHWTSLVSKSGRTIAWTRSRQHSYWRDWSQAWANAQGDRIEGRRAGHLLEADQPITIRSAALARLRDDVGAIRSDGTTIAVASKLLSLGRRVEITVRPGFAPSTQMSTKSPRGT